MTMTRITEPAFQMAVAAFSDRALEEPVAMAYDADDLPDEWLEAALAAKMPPGLEHLDRKMD